MTALLGRLARWLIGVAFLSFPRAFREEHRADALAYFEDRTRDAVRRRGVMGLLLHLAVSLVNTVVSGLGERIHRLWVELRGGGGVLMDCRYGLRSLRRHPGFVVAAALPVALGVAAVTGVFAVVDGILLRPLPYDHSEALVKVGRPLKNGVLAPASTANLIDLEDRVPAFEAVGAVTGGSTVVVDADHNPVLVQISRPTRHFMEVFHLVPVLGRRFAREEYGPPRVAMVTWTFWQRRWGGDPGAVGSVLKTGLGDLQVVGVLPRTWQAPAALTGAGGDLWIPQDYGSRRLEMTRAFGFSAGVARLTAGVPLDVANRQLQVAARALAKAYPTSNTERDGSPKLLQARSLYTETVGDARGRLLLLLGAVGTLLGIACANVANLFLARGAARERELAMCTVMGAGRRRLVTQLLAESVAVAVLGGVVGCALAYATVGALVTLVPDLPRGDSVVVDLRVLAVALGLAVACGVAFGLLPAWTASQRDPGRVLRGGGQPRSGTERLRSALVIGQTALALMLVVEGGLLVNSAVRLSRVDIGFRSEGVLTFRPWLDPKVFGFGPESPSYTYFRGLQEAVAALPGVTSVSGTIFLPGQGLPVQLNIRPPAGGEALKRWRHTVLPGFFRTLDIPLLEGRTFRPQDGPHDVRVAVVSQALARELWPGRSPIGRTLAANDGSEDFTYRVVGVVADIHSGNPRQPPEPLLYESFLQNPWLSALTMIVRHDVKAAALAPRIRTASHATDPRVPLANVVPLDQVVARNTARERHWAILLALFSGLALAIAVVGVYATMSFTVARRMRELGIRRAMGAGGGTVVTLVFRRGMALAVSGILIGAGMALVTARTLHGLLFEIAPSDPATYVAVGAVLLAAALGACALPAIRALKADPLTVLRWE